MIDEVEGLTCEKSGMLMSPRLREGLTEVFVTRARPGRRGSARLRVGTKFHCPACGVPMRDAECPKCGGLLDEFLREIVELNPHRGP